MSDARATAAMDRQARNQARLERKYKRRVARKLTREKKKERNAATREDRARWKRQQYNLGADPAPWMACAASAVKRHLRLFKDISVASEDDVACIIAQWWERRADALPPEAAAGVHVDRQAQHQARLSA